MTEVEVQLPDDAPPEWVAASVGVVLIDGWFQADIVLADGPIGWQDWFTWCRRRRLAAHEAKGGAEAAARRRRPLRAES